MRSVELCFHQPLVDTAPHEQRAMGTALDDSTTLEDDDLVGTNDRRQAVSDDDGGSTLHQLRDGVANGGLRGCVEVRRRLVEYEDARVGQQSPSDGDALPLAPGEPMSALADDGLEAERQ
jgi:hypothetical protein